MRDCGPVVIMFDLEFLRFSGKSTTLPETNSSPLKISLPNRKVVFQPSIFRGYVSFREGNQQKHLFFVLNIFKLTIQHGCFLV